MSKLKLWRSFSLFMVLLLMSSLVAVVPARTAQASILQQAAQPTPLHQTAQLIVPLGSAAAFAVLAGSTVTNTGATTVNGDLGVSPGTAVTGFGPPAIVNGKTYTGVGSLAGQAKLDLTTAYNDAAGRTLAPVTVAGNIGGQTLAPGLYKSTSSLAISSGNLTLDAQGNANAVWIFQIASTLTTTSGRQVILSGGANAANIFWQVGTSATLGTSSVFQGNILADQSITMTTGATLNGRALARVGAVTLDSNIITIPSIPTIIPPTPPTGGITVNPYDTRIIGLNTGYRITMTAGASLNAGDNITITFPTDTTVPDFSSTPENVFVKVTPCTAVYVSGREVTVTIPATAPIVPGQEFTVTFNKDLGILNPSTSGFYNVTVWTSAAPILVTSSPYEITAVKVYTGTIKHYESDNITAAIVAAIASDIIIVPAGIFTEDLVIDKANLTLNSVSGRDSTTIQLVDGVGINVEGTATNFKLGGTTGKGFTVLGGAATTFNIQLTNAPSGVQISYNTINTTGNASHGISIGAAGATDLTVRNNSFTADNLPGTSGWDGSIWGPDVSNVTVSNNTFTGPGSATSGYAVQFAGVTGTSTISGNSISGYGSGIFILGGGPVAGGTTGVSGLTISGNTISGCAKGIRLGHSSQTSDMTTVTVEENTLSTNTVGLYIGDATFIHADQFTIRYNNFSGNNVTYGLQNDNTTYNVTAKHNYWGNASGPSHDGLSYGDSVSTNVVFAPWLVKTSTGTPPAGEIAISTASPLPTGLTGAAYSTPLTATGVAGPYTWASYSGTLPTGLSIAGNNLSGTPTVVNYTPTGFVFAIQVSDGTQATYKDFIMQVYGGGHVITTTSLPNGTKNVPYGQTLQATGGTGSYTWSLNTGSGPLPTGLSLGPSDGKIQGTPTAAGPFNFNVKVESDGYSPGYKDLSITISAAPIPGQKLIGAASDDTGSNLHAANYIFLTRFAADSTDNVTQIKLKASAPGHAKVAIYTDNSSQPQALLNSTASTAVSVGWNTITIPSTAIVAPTYYWLAVMTDTTGSSLWGASGTGKYKSLGYASGWPDPAGTGYTSLSYHSLVAGWAAVTVTAPTVTNSTGETDVTQTTATLNGAITATGGEDPTVIIYWGPTDGGITYTNWANSVNKGTQGGTFSTGRTGLTPGTLYYYRCFAANSGGSNWAGSSESFTTSVLSAPTVTNSTGASIVTATSARLNGAITGTGGANPTVTIYWGDNDGRTTSSNWDNTVPLGVKESGIFYTDITDLNMGTKYYYRCFASNSSGPAWAGSSENFTTLSGGVGQKLIGAASDDTGSNLHAANYIFLTRWAADNTGSVTEIKLKASTPGNAKAAIYADSGGGPGALLNSTASTAVSVGWNTITIPSTTIAAGTNYWLAVRTDTTGSSLWGASGTGAYKPLDYASNWPDPAGIGYTSLSYHSLVAGWTPTATTLPAPPTIVTPKTTITFEWTAPSGATKYRLQVNTASDFTGTSMFDAEVSATSQDVKLTIGTPYYWRVKAGNSGGWSGWSATGSITP
jgi:hypothetical protein